MAEKKKKVKRFYWLKLGEDFFDDDTIRFIEEQENGYKYSNFYLKLCLKSLRNGGRLVRLVGDTLIPYEPKSLARLTGMDIDTVMAAMSLLEKIGCVKILETGEIFMAQIQELVGSETDKAKLMRKHRAEQKALEAAGVTSLPECYSIIEKDEEEEQEEEQDSDQEAEEEEEAPRRSPIPYSEIKNLYNSICLSFSELKTMSDSRKKAIAARIRSGYTLDDFKTMFEKAEASSFLKGQNARNWVASFDWMIKDANFVKILEGNYDDRSPVKSGFPDYSCGEDESL